MGIFSNIFNPNHPVTSLTPDDLTKPVNNQNPIVKLANDIFPVYFESFLRLPFVTRYDVNNIENPGYMVYQIDGQDDLYEADINQVWALSQINDSRITEGQDLNFASASGLGTGLFLNGKIGDINEIVKKQIQISPKNPVDLIAGNPHNDVEYGFFIDKYEQLRIFISYNGPYGDRNQVAYELTEYFNLARLENNNNLLQAAVYQAINPDNQKPIVKELVSKLTLDQFSEMKEPKALISDQEQITYYLNVLLNYLQIFIFFYEQDKEFRNLNLDILKTHVEKIVQINKLLEGEYVHLDSNMIDSIMDSFFILYHSVRQYISEQAKTQLTLDVHTEMPDNPYTDYLIFDDNPYSEENLLNRIKELNNPANYPTKIKPWNEPPADMVKHKQDSSKRDVGINTMARAINAINCGIQTMISSSPTRHPNTSRGKRTHHNIPW